MPLPIKQPPFQNVVAGSTATLPNLHMGDRVDALILVLGGTFAINKMDEIRVKLGGVPIVTITGAHLQDLNEFMGRNVTTTIIPIWFANPNAKTLLGYEQGALETDKGYSSFQIEVDINGTGVTSPTLECWMLKGAPKLNRQDAAKFRAILKATEGLTVTGKQAANVPLGGSTNLLSKVHFFHSNITSLEVKKQSLELLSDAPVAVLQYMQNELNRSSQSGHLVFDPEFLNHTSDQVSQLRQGANGEVQAAAMEFNVTTSGSDTAVMYGEVIGTIGAV